MKKNIFIIIVLIVSLSFITACGKKETVKKVDYKKIMDEYATDYYGKVEKPKGMTHQLISIADLKVAIEKRGMSYDLKKLENCKDTSYAEFAVNEDNTEILKKEFFMECSK